MIEEKKKDPGGWSAVAAALVGALLGTSVGYGIGYATWEPCIPDPDEFMDCFLDGPGWRAAGGALIGFPVGLVAGLVLWELWRRWRRDHPPATWVWYGGWFRRAGADLYLRLDGARAFFDAGDQRRAVRELWFAEAIARNDRDALLDVLSVATTFDAAAKPRHKAHLGELVRVLQDDLDTAAAKAERVAARSNADAAR